MTNRVVDHLNNKEVAEIISIERGVLKTLNGGCQLPLGVYATKNAQGFSVWAGLGQEDGHLKRVQMNFESSTHAVEEIIEALKKK